MTFPAGAHQQYLEAPYVAAAQAEAAFEAWCERTDTDPDDADAWDRFEADMEDEAEAAAEAAAEARADAEYDE